ncbi:MAG: hypothetical protein LLG42_00380 [Chloroflexi bacterium]|nr:hypothetical protein [Chloroflexota bacterium]
MEEIDFFDLINKIIEDYRLKGVSESFLARKIGLSQATLNTWKNRSRGIPRDEKIRASLISFFKDSYPEIYGALGVPNPKSIGITVPLVGRVRAGEPIPLPPSDFSSFDPETTIQVLRTWLPKNIEPADLFALEVEGDSMRDMGIEDDTTIILRKQDTAESGDVVVAYFDGDNSSTLKRFYRDNGHIRLQPENPDYLPIIVDADKVRIAGKLVMSIKIYK